MEWDDDALKNLRYILASLFLDVTDARMIVVDAKLDPAYIAWSTKPINIWFNILESAKHHPGKVDDIVAQALIRFPHDEALKTAATRRPAPVVKGPEVGDWRGPTDKRRLEKIIGAVSTLVPITYLEIGVIRARSVARVRLVDGSSATGFLTKDNVLITAHHVLPDTERASSAIVQFNYQQTAQGLSAPMEEFNVVPDAYFKTDEHNDWTAVRLNGNPNEKWGVLALSKANPRVGDFVNIIQHPDGGLKKISYSGNVLAYVGNGRVQYLTDTMPGSSGSPVFDKEWNVIAVHHSGGWLSEPDAPANGSYYRNEGTLIDLVLEGLA
jgi:V8-like Glu-specific endopeptidase